MSYDWGVGRYERTASQLAVASARVVDVASIGPADRVLDVACGTGNAALLAAEVRARAIGVDRAERLVSVARERARQESVSVAVAAGDAVRLPFVDASFDVVLSVFGVIFAQPGKQAVAELLRVARPGGRIVLSAWTPTGPVHEVLKLIGDAVASVVARRDRPDSSTQWGEAAVLERLFAPARVTVRDERLAFVGRSARAWALDQYESHPGWAAARAILEPAGRWEEVAGRGIELLEAANEDPTGFRATSGYLIATVER